MEIRKATINDTENILMIYEDAKRLLKESGSDQWQNGYPNIDSIRHDLKEDNLYVACLNQEVIGTAYISPMGEPTYKAIDGKWLNDEPYLVIHRIATKGTSYHHGVAKEIIRFSEQAALQRGINNIRVDTHFLNIPMQNLLKATGFKDCGIIFLNLPKPFENRRLAYHKVLSNNQK
jgi:RimJ/RimL family protein N-acetyltransferase